MMNQNEQTEKEAQGALELLRELVSTEENQNRQLKKQLFYTRIFAGAGCALALILAVAFFCLVPPVLSAMDTAVDAMERATRTMEQADETLQLVDGALKDIGTLFEEDGLVVRSSETMEQALEKIQAMDIESLNAAIKNLGDVVEPLAQFFGRFGR